MNNSKSGKKTFFGFTLLALLFLTAVVFAFYRFKAPNEHAEIRFKVNVFAPVRIVNLDTVERNNNVAGTFVLYNRDVRPWHIKEIRPDCHCTSGTSNKKIVQPGDSVQVTLKFNYEDADQGYFQKSVSIESNAEKSPIMLSLRGFLKS